MKVDLHELDFAMYADFEELACMGTAIYPDNQWQRHIYIDRGSDVLVTAHTDSVQCNGERHLWLSKNYLVAPVIDNRLGVYLALFYLPQMGINVDVLLTDNEEMCRSTATFFDAEKQYNWIASFDRMGEDVVTYQYESKEWEDILMGAGFKIGFGSYSCIADLEHLGSCAVNVGCGMQDYHSKEAYADLNVLNRQLQRFEKLYHDHKDTHIVFDAQAYHRDLRAKALSYQSVAYVWKNDMLVEYEPKEYGALQLEAIHVGKDENYYYGEPTESVTYDICDYCGVHEDVERMVFLDESILCAWCANNIFGGTR